MRKLSAVVLCGLFIASAFAQEAANPKPAPERNNGAFLAIFCSLITVGISLMAALTATKNRKASENKAKDEELPGA